MRTAFFGTPPLAVPALAALAQTTDVALVVCQPDRPHGRGLKLRACAVKHAAEALGLTVHQPVKVRTGNLDEWLRERDVELGVVLAYGRILPPRVLEAPRLGCVNLHASLLPKYRGAAPINWAIAQGETETGVCLMRMEEGLDTGPVFASRRLSIGPNQNAGELSEQISQLCAVMVRDDLARVFEGTVPVPQDEALATYAPPIDAGHTRIDWHSTSERIHNQVRAFSPDPGAHTEHRGRRIKLLETRRTDLAHHGHTPGTILEARGDCLLVETTTEPLRIEQAQVPGKKPQCARDLINGRQFRANECFDGSLE